MICSRCHLNCLPCRQTSLASDKAQSLTRTHGAPTAHTGFRLRLGSVIRAVAFRRAYTVPDSLWALSPRYFSPSMPLYNS